MNVQNALLKTVAAIAFVILSSAVWATKAEAAYTLRFRTLGPTGGKLQVYMEGRPEPLFEEDGHQAHWSKPVNVTLPPVYTNQPIIFRFFPNRGLMGHFMVLVADVDVIDENGRLMNLGAWYYSAPEAAAHFQGFVGHDNLLLEKEKFTGICKPGDEGDYYNQFKSDPVTGAPDLQLGYGDVTLLNSAGEEITNYDVQPGDTIFLRADVQNRGSLDADKAKVGLYNVNWQEMTSESVSLSAGENKTVELSWTAPKPQKSVFLRIAADRDNKLTEANEYNNHANKIITGPHPFLWFYGHEIPGLHAKFKKHTRLTEWWSTVESDADSALKNDYKAGGIPPVDWATGSAKLAFAYLITGDDKYARKAKESLLYLPEMTYISATGWTAYHYGWAFDWMFNYLKKHDAEDVNQNGQSDLSEIQDKLAQFSTTVYSGWTKCDFPSGFGGADHQTHGENAASQIAVALSLLGYDKTMVVDTDGIAKNAERRGRKLRHVDVYSVFHGADHFAIDALGHYLGYPDPSRYGNTIFYNDEGVPSWLGAMHGEEGLFEEGSYYSQPGLIYQAMDIAQHLGIDMCNQKYLHGVADFWISTMPPDRTWPMYTHCKRRSALERYKLAPAARIFKESNGHVYMWYWKDLGEPEMYGANALHSILTFDPELYEKAAPPDSCWGSPTQLLPKAGLAILRSDWSRDASYLMLRGSHRTATGLSSAHTEGDATDFNLYAKGEYLVVNTGDGRFSFACRLEGGDYADADDKGAWECPWDSWEGGRSHNLMLHGPTGCNLIQVDNLTGMRHDNVPNVCKSFRVRLDKGYIENCIDTSFIDYAEVRSHWGDVHQWAPKISTIDINNTRSVFPGEDYFIMVDDLKSLNDASHHYAYKLHLAGKQVETNTTVVNKLYGNYMLKKLDGRVLVGGKDVPWDKRDTGHPNCDAKCPWPRYTFPRAKELVWKTKNLKDEDIALKVFFVAPSVQISVERGDGDMNYTRNMDPYINPYVKATANGKNMKYVTFLYPWKLGRETGPNITQLRAAGGYAGGLSLGDRKDVILVKDETATKVAGDDLGTDARIAFCSSNSAMDYYFIRDGSILDYKGKHEVTVSEKVDYLLVKHDGETRTLKVKGEGTNVVIALHGLDRGTTYRVKRDGGVYSGWKMAENGTAMMITTDVGAHTFAVEPVR